MKTNQRICILLIAVAITIFAGCAPNKSPAEQLAEKNKAIVTQIYKAFNANDWNTLQTMLTPEFVDHNPAPGQKPGFEGVKEVFAQMSSAFPDMKMEVQEIIAEGDFVCARIYFSGTQKGEFMGMPSTGKSFKTDGYDFVRLVNGKVAERWGISNDMSMMMQLGMMPMPAPAPNAKGKEMKEKK